ncbi:MAG: hypothetical protein V4635_08490 [Bacteroidota bacterium]
MKAIIFLVLATALCVSCKKSYTCECTTNTVVTVPAFPGYPGGTFTLPSQTESKAYSEKMTKSQAKSACEHEKETLEATAKDAFAKNQFLKSFKYSLSTTCFVQ